MKQHAIKLEIINNRNDDRDIKWFFCNTEKEKNQWIEVMKREATTWNLHTHGVVSIRYYNFTEYLISDLMNADISELKGITLGELIELIKNANYKKWK